MKLVYFSLNGLLSPSTTKTTKLVCDFIHRCLVDHLFHKSLIIFWIFCRTNPRFIRQQLHTSYWVYRDHQSHQSLETSEANWALWLDDSSVSLDMEFVVATRYMFCHAIFNKTSWDTRMAKTFCQLYIVMQHQSQSEVPVCWGGDTYITNTTTNPD